MMVSSEECFSIEKLEEKIKDYPDARNYPDKIGTSIISIYKTWANTRWVRRM